MKDRTKEELLKVIEEYEQICIKEGPIKLIFLEGKERELNQTSLEAFVKDFIVTNHAEQLANTIEIEKMLDINEAIQCRVGARRSIGDIYRVALQHYNKPVTLLEVMEAGYNVIENNKDFKKGYYSFVSFVCGSIYKRVFAIYSGGPYGFTDKPHDYPTQKEFDITVYEYNFLFQNNKKKEVEIELAEELN